MFETTNQYMLLKWLGIEPDWPKLPFVPSQLRRMVKPQRYATIPKRFWGIRMRTVVHQ
jgi:hypothetical protein